MTIATWEVEALLPKAIKKESEIRPDRKNFIKEYHELKNRIISDYISGVHNEENHTKFSTMQIQAEIIVCSWLKHIQPTIIL